MLLIRFLLLAAVPLAAQAPTDPFAGRFSGPSLELEFVPAPGGYTGVARAGRQELPLLARPTPEGLFGEINAAGTRQPFTAVRQGALLLVQIGGVTHRLEIAIPDPLLGDWESSAGPVRLGIGGAALLSGKPHRWTAENGEIVFTGNGEALKVPYRLENGKWIWKLPGGELEFTRPGSAGTGMPGIAGAWQGPSGPVQVNLDGTAAIAGVNYRYSYQGNELKLEGPDGAFTATVETAPGRMVWSVNGKRLEFERAAATWAFGTADRPMELVGRWCHSESGHCLTFLADGSLVSQSGSGPAERGTWTATSAEIAIRLGKAAPLAAPYVRKNVGTPAQPALEVDGKTYVSAYPRPPWPQVAAPKD